PRWRGDRLFGQCLCGRYRQQHDSQDHPCGRGDNADRARAKLRESRWHGQRGAVLYPSGVATDSSGNVYVGDSYNYTIRKITPAGAVTTLAGGGGYSGRVDGTGRGARFYYPDGVATDSSGNVYVADSDNYTIRKITPAGVVTTLAGVARFTGSADGTGGAARFNYPWGVARGSSGNVYVGDGG